MASAGGYGKPPKHRQFKKGTSGNPKGRPKGSRNLRTLVAELQQERVMVTEKGRRRSLPAMEVLLKRTMADALKGDAKAVQQIIKLAMTFGDEGSDPGQNVSAAADSEVVQRALDRMLREYQKETR